jgi:hypothetical protein
MRNRTGVGIAELVALLAPAVLIVAFAIALCRLHPGYIADEKSHYPAVQLIRQGDWAAVRWLPMPPTYHALAAAASHAVGNSVVALRGFNTALGLVCILVAWGIVRQLRPHDSAAIARVALNPLFLSLCPLVYTDILSLMMLLMALWAHLRGRRVVAAIALVGAMLVRQSNIIWPLLFVALPTFEALDCSPPESLRSALVRVCGALTGRECGPYAAALVIGVLLVLVPNPLTDDVPAGNTPGLNIALFYAWALAGAALWLPVWLPGFIRSPWTARLGARAPLLTVAVLAAISLAANYHSKHGWNTDPSSFRNWPLIAMQHSLPLRLALCALLVAMLIETARRTWASAERYRLLAIWCVGILFLVPHVLVDPRYFLIPTALLDFYAPLSRPESTRLAVWYGVLSLATIAMMLIRPGGLVHL